MGYPKTPKHIGIILDGNRRYSRRLMMQPWKGHEFGAKKVEQLLGWSAELGIKELTLYSLSVENFKRPKEELDFLMQLFRSNFEKIASDERIHKNRIRVKAIGRLHMLPKDVQEKIKVLMDATKDYSDYMINFAVAYGGRQEIVDAAKKIAEKVMAGKMKVEEIDEEAISENVYLSDEPDLIIRTGGDHRTSNFLLWQSYYSEWFFIEKLWPEFEKDDLIRIIEEFKSRERRFGK